MKRRLFHLTIKATGEHKYYGSLAEIVGNNEKRTYDIMNKRFIYNK